ncbi:MAG TPA: AMP-binding protein [Burkholderiales bacterium]|nr:AMP-binding protein [Burkholderiales bacterium]
MQSTMMRMPLSLNHVLERAGTLFPESEIVSRLPDKSLRRHRYADFYRRARALGAALQRLGLRKGERVATLCWNHLATTSSLRSPALDRQVLEGEAAQPLPLAQASATAGR